MLAALPFGLTTWIGFLYIGMRAERRAWLWAAAGYGAAALSILVLAAVSPAEPGGRSADGTWQSTLGAIALATTWFGGCVHALVANRAWLDWRSRR
jgi:hypothetical protein